MVTFEPGAWSGSDKIAHLLEYAILGFLIHRALGARGIWAFVAAVGTASLIGGLDEIYQSTVPGRFPSLYDWLADTSGGFVGVGLRSVLESRQIAVLRNREQGVE